MWNSTYLINLNPNEYSQEFHYYRFAVKFNKCVGICNSMNDLSNEVCIPNKTEDLNLSMFNMNTRINESKTLTNHTSCECKCKFERKKSNPDQLWNNDKCWCECKKHHICQKDYVWNSATCNCENEKHLASIIDDSPTICDEAIESFDEELKTIPKTKSFNRKKVTCNTQNFCVLLAFLLITIALLIAVSTYCYLIKYRAKEEYLLHFHDTKSKQLCIGSINWKWEIKLNI